MDQISSIETAVTNIELVAHHLTSKDAKNGGGSGGNPCLPLPSSATAASAAGAHNSSVSHSGGGGGGGGKVTLGERRASAGGGKSGGGFGAGGSAIAAGKKAGGGRNGSANTSAGSGGASSGGGGSVMSITDAVVQVEVLKEELERARVGLMLLSLSIEKLMDIVTTEPPGFCPSIFEIFTGGAITGGGGQDKPVHVQKAIGGSYTVGGKSRAIAGAGSSSSGGSNNSKKIAMPAMFNSKKRQGYETLSLDAHSTDGLVQNSTPLNSNNKGGNNGHSSSSSNSVSSTVGGISGSQLFSIEGSADDDDVYN